MKTKINFSIALIILVSILSILMVSAQTDYSNCPVGYGGMMYGLYGSSAMVLGWVISLLVIVLIVAAIYWLIKSAQKKR